MELKTARLTLLIDPNKKAAFERLCATQDRTASQVVRQLIREYLAAHGVEFVASGADIDDQAGQAEPGTDEATDNAAGDEPGEAAPPRRAKAAGKATAEAPARSGARKPARRGKA